MRRTYLYGRLGVLALATSISVGLVLAQAPAPPAFDTALENAEKAALERALAGRAAAEKAVALKTATATMDALNDAMKKALDAKVAAERVGAADAKTIAEKTAADLEAQAKAAKTTVDKATTEKAAADKVVQEKTGALNEANKQLTAARVPIDKAASDASKVLMDTTTAREAADKVFGEKTNAANQAATAAAAAKAAADKAEADRVAAAKVAVDKASALKAAADKAAAEKDPAKKKPLDEAAAKAAAEKTAAEKALGEKATAAKAAADKAAPPKAAADKAKADQLTAENAVKAKAAAERVARHKAAETRALADGGLKVLPESAWDHAKARHLLVRAGFGGTPEEVARLHEMGLVQAVNHLVDFQYQQTTADDEIRIEAPERPLPSENKLSQLERDRLNQRRDNKRNQDFYRLRQWWMKRLVESPRPLQEKLTLFWHGHFATEWQKIAWPHLLHTQNNLFREHAAGNFGGLLYGIVHDPAMILYLDNQVNYKGHPNQNLAREIMELFAMGVNQGYTEYDIREGARALTGYTYDHYTGQFRFNYAQHDTDPKTLFGQAGTWTGDDFVTLILQQPHTARFISGKLYEFFAASDPDPKVVTRLATVLRGNQYELAPMLKNLFMSEEFYSPRVMGTQIKSPIQLLAGTLRDFGVKGADYNALCAWSADMEQDLFQPPNVKGWYGGRDWVNANLIFRRYNYVASLIRSVPQPNNQRGFDLVAFLENKGITTSAQAVDYLAKTSLVVPLSEEQRKELTEHLGMLPPPAEWAKQRDQLNARLRQVLVLMLTTPESQMT